MLCIAITFLACTSPQKEETVYDIEILKGKVSCIVNKTLWEYDSVVFSYNKEGKVIGYHKFTNGEINGRCEYTYDGINIIEQIYYDKTGRDELRCIIEFDDRRNIATYSCNGYIYPDTTNMKLLYRLSNSYNLENKLESAYEYFSDGTPSYRYNYKYDADGTLTEERIIDSTGKIFTITKTVNDKHGNAIMVSETMPQDSTEWNSITIDYKYDKQGNWTERKVNGRDPRLMDNVTDTSRRIYYIDL